MPVPGMTLCEAFYREAAKPILDRLFPQLDYSAALLGSGSEVLGYDDVRSTDHQWGPRFQLFLSEDDHPQTARAISDALSSNLPHRFLGYSTSFGAADTGGVRLQEELESGPVHHMIHIDSIRTFFSRSLGCDPYQELRPTEWLTFEEHRLLTLARGKVFHDGLNLQLLRDKFSYYPRDVWLYLLASEWQKIAQEEHFVGRCGDVGDEIGSQIIAARLVHSLMYLCFLMEKRYAPYSKWFGTTFAELGIARTLAPLLQYVLSAEGWKEREAHLSRAYECVAKAHNALNITAPMETGVSPFYTRPYLVIHAERFASAIWDAIDDPSLKALDRPIGSVNQFLNSTDILTNTDLRNRLSVLWE